MTPDPSLFLTALGMGAQFFMLLIWWELRQGRKLLERQNELLAEKARA